MFFIHVRLHSFAPPAPDPVSFPQILVRSPFITPGWCSVTLECRASGDTKDLKVTWESKGLPRELEWRGTPGPASNSWTLTLNLSLSQPNASVTCVVSNQVDQKTATLDLGEVCVHGECHLPERRGILGAQVHWGEGSGLFSPLCHEGHLPLGHPIQEPGKHIQFASAFKCLSHLRSPFHPLPRLVHAADFQYLSPHSFIIHCVSRVVFRKSKLDCVNRLCHLRDLTSTGSL